MSTEETLKMGVKILVFGIACFVTFVDCYSLVYDEDVQKQPANSKENCICLQGNFPKLSTVLTTDGSNLERLVLYLYRNPQTGVMQLFTPKKNIQIKFPDPTVNIVDEIRAPKSPALYESLNLNPYFIDLQIATNSKSKQPTSVPVSTIVVQPNQTSDYSSITVKEIKPNLPQAPEGPTNKPIVQKFDTNQYVNMMDAGQHQLKPGGIRNEATIKLIKTYLNFPNRYMKQYLPALKHSYQINSSYKTFHEWFEQQMQLILQNDQMLQSDIDVSSLKKLIERTLIENQLYITEEGFLIDSNGNIIDVDNLRLRPITTVLDTTASNLNIPPNLSYFEAVLLSSVNLPNTLGAVIPLQKTNLSNISEMRNYTSETDPTLFFKQRGLFENLFNNLKKLDLSDMFGSLNKASQSNFATYGTTGPSQTGHPGYLYSEGSSYPSFVASNPFYLNDGRELGYRIVGGNAATGSGTPISSRGRSGLV